EATDINIKDEIFVNYTRFNNLITKLQTDSFMNSTWNIILGDIEIDFDRYRDKISHIIPMNDGYNINIFTLQRTKRTIKDFYTFSINGYFDPIITSIIPQYNVKNDSSESMFTIIDAHKLIYDFFWKITCEDQELIIYLIKMLGIYISGDYKDQSLLI